MFGGPEMMARLCYGYVRVSTYKQSKDGISMDDQKHRITKYCRENNLALVEIVEEPAMSGSEKMRAKRIKLTDLLDGMPSGSVLIVTDISRLSRSIRDFLAITKQLENKKCQLIAITQRIDTGSSIGRFSANLLAILNQYEVDLTVERNANIRKYKDDMGEFVGKIPYGWKLSNGPKSPVVEIPEEQAVIQLIYELAAPKESTGKRTYTNYRIAQILTEMRVTPPGNAVSWQGSNIERILSRKSGPAKTKPQFEKDSYLVTPMTERGLPILPPDIWLKFAFNSLEEFSQALSASFEMDPSDDEGDD
jgi:DNA invertase Pin-like site-specific DNA recombinase